MRPTYVIRTRWARTIAVVGWAACLAYAVGAARDAGTIATGHLAWAALAALLVHTLWWRPAVEVSDGGVTVRDLLRTSHVPWPAVREVGARWSLTVVTASGQIGSWALPASSPARRAQREARARRRGEEVEDPGFTAGEVEPTAEPTADGGAPAGQAAPPGVPHPGGVATPPQAPPSNAPAGAPGSGEGPWSTQAAQSWTAPGSTPVVPR